MTILGAGEEMKSQEMTSLGARREKWRHEIHRRCVATAAAAIAPFPPFSTYHFFSTSYVPLFSPVALVSSLPSFYFSICSILRVFKIFCKLFFKDNFILFLYYLLYIYFKEYIFNDFSLKQAERGTVIRNC